MRTSLCVAMGFLASVSGRRWPLPRMRKSLIEAGRRKFGLMAKRGSQDPSIG